MAPEKHLISPDILTTSMAVMTIAVGAAAVLRANGENGVASLPGHDNAMALSRLLNALPVDITAPRADLPEPRYADKISNHVSQRQPFARRWGGHFPGGY